MRIIINNINYFHDLQYYYLSTSENVISIFRYYKNSFLCLFLINFLLKHIFYIILHLNTYFNILYFPVYRTHFYLPLKSALKIGLSYIMKVQYFALIFQSHAHSLSTSKIICIPRTLLKPDYVLHVGLHMISYILQAVGRKPYKTLCTYRSHILTQISSVTQLNL